MRSLQRRAARRPPHWLASLHDIAPPPWPRHGGRCRRAGRERGVHVRGSVGPAAAGASPPSATAASPTPTDDPTSPAPPAPKPLTIAVAGDVHFEGVLRGPARQTRATALAPATATLAAADVAIVNLETSVGTGGRPEPGKRYTFQAPPTAFTALAAAGIDVASMANNHALDFGRAPLPGTFDAIETARSADPPLAVVGIGRDVDEAFRPARTEVDGTVVATIGATVADHDPTADPTGTVGRHRRLRRHRRRPRPGPAAARRSGGPGGRPTWSSSTCTGVSRASGARATRSDPWRQTSSRRAPTSSSAATPTCSRATGGWGAATWRTGSGTTPGTRSRRRRRPRRGCSRSPCGPRRRGRAGEVIDAAWEGARIGADGLPTPLAGAAAAGFDTDVGALRACAGFAQFLHVMSKHRDRSRLA